MQLKPEEKLMWIKIANTKGVLYARNKYIEKYKYLYNYKIAKRFRMEIARLIRKWIKLYNLNGMNGLKSKTGTKKGPNKGRSKKPVPAKNIWEKLEEKEKFEIFKDWLKQEREKSKSKKMNRQNEFHNVLKQARRIEVWQLSKQGIKLFRDRGFINKKINKVSQENSRKIKEIATKNARLIRKKRFSLMVDKE